ncbi:ATP-dependent transcriptional regulator [Rubrobacter radiotolerans]|uniref:ATP-dependent transcriptional regulator n=1 Tax=Rubrobacter radiotolerans TaxID=42256 RepID=A0A023X0C8_RUBRA|nr:tetratricopeptide repeat protein [Rubrobacter radiotolerans]AHY45641.1 ATP-dependent transcriptional regulator [Rubrobacter radiotolerans]MDX5893055.1 tetratricopeptide repeat protein [Rubrobacter radiotolerans]SMC02971.1 LuxR family transcriptional regulator, maltose regulon positive regulatory protein [Rubrobacter radiotolerans DSM 5868]
MATPILATKLYAPPPRPEVVPRARLTERLNEGLDRRLTLVCAPAGFGKTTLIGGWVAGLPRPAGWLSLDEADNDPARFLAYLVAALRTVAADIGEGVLGALGSPQPPPTEAILTVLLNEITTVEDDLILVLDDYHVIDTGAVDDALAFLIEHLPPRMHLVIATREDPNLPLARLRARGQLLEVRAADLRFTPSEAAEFLKGVMGLSLSEEDIAALESCTEGWIAGLQLAALSMRGREDVAGFIRAFAGDNRYIVDYLVEEVLGRQPERVRGFLLKTSILERLSGPLCDAVTGQQRSSALLEALERGNLFVVPLDDRRRWFRYHHLFADVLRARMMEEQPDRASTLHRRASEWYERNGSPADAIRHALAAGDFGRAADLVELAALEMLGSSSQETLYRWLMTLPDEVVRARPVLSAYYAFTLFGRGDFEAVDARLRDAERWLDTEAETGVRREAPSVGMVVVDEAAFGSLPGTISIARAYIAGARGDVRGTVKHARQALELLPEDDHLWRGAAAALLGIAHWTDGDLEAAHRSFAEGVAHQQIAGHTRFQIAGTHILADIRIAQGRLHEAVRTYEQSLRVATEQGEPVWGTANLYVGLSELHRERGDLRAAKQHLLRSKELGEHVGLPETRYRWYVALARIKEAQGDLDGALDLLDEAEIQYVESPDPDVRPIAALKTRVWVAQGRLAEALGWAREQGLSAHDDLSYLREFEHITLARVLLARYKSDREERSIHEAMGLLKRLLKAAEEGGRMGSVIEILMLQALAHEAQGDSPSALAPLERALTLAEPEGYVRVFVDEGRPMAGLLSEAVAHGIMPDYAGRLLAVFEAETHKSEDESHLPNALPARSVIEPLSARELEILRLIAQGLSNRQIGERLFLALSTVKGHNRIIFSKLMVGRRTEAVARARELGLL